MTPIWTRSAGLDEARSDRGTYSNNRNEDALRVRSGRGWNMAPVLPELRVVLRKLWDMSQSFVAILTFGSGFVTAATRGR